MGSYMSVVNNTPHEWHCKVGADEAAVKIVSTVLLGIGTAVAAVATVGTAVPLVAKFGTTGVMSLFGVSSHALHTIHQAGEVAHLAHLGVGYSEFAVHASHGVHDALHHDGFVTVPSNQSHAYGPMTLSLWREATCTRAYILNERTIRTETVRMRPILSGATAGSTREHDIQYWIENGKVEIYDVVADDTPGSPTLAPPYYNSTSTQHKRSIEEEPLVFKVGETNVTELDIQPGNVVYIYP